VRCWIDKRFIEENHGIYVFYVLFELYLWVMLTFIWVAYCFVRVARMKVDSSAPRLFLAAYMFIWFVPIIQRMVGLSGITAFWIEEIHVITSMLKGGLDFAVLLALLDISILPKKKEGEGFSLLGNEKLQE